MQPELFLKNSTFWLFCFFSILLTFEKRKTIEEEPTFKHDSVSLSIQAVGASEDQPWAWLDVHDNPWAAGACCCLGNRAAVEGL